MADKGHTGYADTDEERQRQHANEGGHASHEKGAAHESHEQASADGGRRGNQAHTMANANQGDESAAESGGTGQTEATGGSHPRPRKTRGGTHDQHVTAGKRGGSRIRELIELGYKYEQEHGIGPGKNERSKLAAKRRTTKGGGNEPAAEGEGGD